MSARFHPSARDRAGNISVFAALLTIVFAAMVAFAVDLGYLNNSKTELQRTADSAALAAASDLIYKGTPGTPVNLTTGIASARTDAVAYASRNPICSSAPSLSQAGDIVIGYMASRPRPRRRQR
jgi:Flp pilus assembly protein TadG